MTILHYHLSHVRSQDSVALFAPEPAQEITLQEIMSLVDERPRDSFFHAFALRRLMRLSPEEVTPLYQDLPGREQTPSGWDALLVILALVRPGLRHLIDGLSQEHCQRLAALSPLNYGRVLLQPDHSHHQALIQAVQAGVQKHTRLTALPRDVLEGIRPTKGWEGKQPAGLAQVREALGEITPEPLPPVREVFQEAMHRLYSIGAISGQEMRHQASLSPWAVQRNWMLDVAATSGTTAFRLSGLQTAYGRGLDLEGARVSCAMEIVERFSAYATIQQDTALTCARSYSLTKGTLVQGTYEELCRQGTNPLNPARLCLEAPYQGEALYWMAGEAVGPGQEGSSTQAFLPVQCAFLFSNLDEPDLFSGLSSTGLAAGTLMDQAKVNAIVEVLERDSQGTHPFDPAACFRITARPHTPLHDLLRRYANLNIAIQFQDITHDLGLPCYRCYVIGPDGQIITGTGAHLEGYTALLAALTETPYPFPGGPNTQPDPRELPIIQAEDLPCYATGSPTGDRRLLETLLGRNGLTVYYADLTSKRLGFPVVRAIIPGLEIMTDRDAFARVSPRLYRHYLRLLAAPSNTPATS